MTKFSRTWWGDRFIQALEAFTDDSRLQRGRSYARGGKVGSSVLVMLNHELIRERGTGNREQGKRIEIV